MSEKESSLLGGHKIQGDLPCMFCQARASSICSVLKNDEIACLNDIITRRQIGTGNRLFIEGDRAGHYFVVTEGCVMVFKEAHDGRRQITGFLYPGDMLGLNNLGRFSYTAEAISDTVVCEYPIDKLTQLFGDFPEMEHWMLRHCSNELASAHDQMFLLGRKNAAEKIATFLWFLLLRIRFRNPDATAVNLPMSRRDIADYLGLTVETVSRTITRMRVAGTIKTIGNEVIEVLDVQGLQILAGADDTWVPATARAA